MSIYFFDCMSFHSFMTLRMATLAALDPALALSLLIFPHLS